jgi:hypothetical protein
LSEKIQYSGIFATLRDGGHAKMPGPFVRYGGRFESVVCIEHNAEGKATHVLVARESERVSLDDCTDDWPEVRPMSELGL